MDIIFNGQSCPIKNFHVGVRGNNLVDVLVFVVKRYTVEGVDLSEFTPYVKLQNDKQNYYDKDGKIEVETQKDILRLKYTLRRKTTAYPSFELQLQFEKPANAEGDDVLVWQSDTLNFTLSKSIPADAAIAKEHPAILQELTARVENLENIKIIDGGIV